MKNDKNKELTGKVQDVIKKIRPYIEADGGDVKFIDLTEDKVVKVKL